MSNESSAETARRRRVLSLWIPPRWVKAVLFSTATLLVLALIAGVIAIRTLSRDLPSPARLQTIRPPSKTLVLSADGDTLHEYFRQNRVIVGMETVPRGLIDAVISTEDRRFFDHYGIDLGGIVRAAWVNLKTRRKDQGASTLTQQLARSLFLTTDKRWERKVRELLLAVQIERTYTKDEILEMYLNTVYFGHGGAYGVESGARAFFGRGVSELEPAEYTLLVGILPNPGFYSPVSNIDRAYQRRAVVLRSMVRANVLSADEAKLINETLVDIVPRAERETLAPYFVESIRQYLESHYGVEQLYEEGLRVYTTLDAKMQRFAIAALEEHLIDKENERNYEMTRALYDSLIATAEEPPLPTYLQGALLAMDPRTGEVRAMVGGRDYEASKWNRATQATRQPGSIFKPFLYTAALQRGWTPASILLDAPVEIDTGSDELWRPVNFDETFRGPVAARYALAHSINIPAVRLILEVGTQPVLDVARRMGVESQIPDVYSIALGSGEASLQELVTAYCAFANNGIRTRPILFTRITNSRGEILEENHVYQEEVLDERVNFLMVDMMRTGLEEGTGRSAKGYGWRRESAGKTGTTDRNTDAWFIGFTPDMVCGIWVGFDEKVSMGRRRTGAVMALPIFAKTMTPTMADRPELHFNRPAGLLEKLVCSDSGQLATAACLQVTEEIFVESMVPTRLCELHTPGSSPIPENVGDFDDIDKQSTHTDEFDGLGGRRR